MFGRKEKRVRYKCKWCGSIINPKGHEIFKGLGMTDEELNHCDETGRSHDLLLYDDWMNWRRGITDEDWREMKKQVTEGRM